MFIASPDAPPIQGLALLGLLTLGNLVVMSAVLPFAMGRHPSGGARAVQRYFLLQAALWLCLLGIHRFNDRSWAVLFGIGSTTAVALAQWTMSQALAHWLGPRPGQAWLRLLCIAAPAGVAVLWFLHPVYRMVWPSVVHALGLVLLARMCLHPVKDCERGWRGVLCVYACTMAAVLVLRAVAVLSTGHAPQFLDGSAINQGMIVFSNTGYIVVLICMTAAWRDESYQQLRTLASTDALTGLLNRHGFDARAPALFAQTHRKGLPLAVLMLDLDYFKRVNDLHGHPAGDEALRLFAHLLQSSCRAEDVVARLGGEEFCVLLPARTLADVQTLDRELRERLVVAAPLRLGFSLDFSSGLAWHEPRDTDLPALLQRADQALYAAKALGRGRLQEADPALVAA